MNTPGELRCVSRAISLSPLSKTTPVSLPEGLRDHHHPHIDRNTYTQHARTFCPRSVVPVVGSAFVTDEGPFSTSTASFNR